MIRLHFFTGSLFHLKYNLTALVSRFELEIFAPKTNVLPLHYTKI